MPHRLFQQMGCRKFSHVPPNLCPQCLEAFLGLADRQTNLGHFVGVFDLPQVLDQP